MTNILLSGKEFLAVQVGTTDSGEPIYILTAALTDATGTIITSPATSARQDSRYILASGTLTRPANTTAYAANDAVTDNGGAAISITMSDTNDYPFTLEAIRITTPDTGPGSAAIAWEVWVYNAATTPAADNAAFTSQQSGLIGRFTGTWFATSDGSAVCLVPNDGARRICLPQSGAKTLNLTCKTLGIFTPSANSTVYTFKAEGFQGRS